VQAGAPLGLVEPQVVHRAPGGLADLVADLQLQPADRLHLDVHSDLPSLCRTPLLHPVELCEDRLALPGELAPAARLLVADPVYQADDPRLKKLRNARPAAQTTAQGAPDSIHGDFARLRFTAEEAAGISAQFPPADVDELTGVDATRERLLALDWSQYRFIHFATHGIVDAQVPELSALILSSYDAKGEVTDRAVRVADVSLQTLNADVAVLSACETALGAEVRSEGLVGIGSTMLARGARAVVASLWPVSDEIGASLMTEFYRRVLQDSMSPQAALGTAMRSVMSHDATADPALWAAFQVSVAALGPGRPGNHAGPSGP